MINPNEQYRVVHLNMQTGAEVDKQLLGHEIQQNFPALTEPKVGQTVIDWDMYTITTVAWF